jgi:hypothetical protein
MQQCKPKPFLESHEILGQNDWSVGLLVILPGLWDHPFGLNSKNSESHPFFVITTSAPLKQHGVDNPNEIARDIENAMSSTPLRAFKANRFDL